MADWHDFGNQERRGRMIAYTMVGTNDLPRAGAFYDAVFGPLGCKRLFQGDDKIAWGRDRASPMFFVTKPFDGKPATVGNGVMIALAMKNPAEVNTVHAAALKHGAKDEGAAGPRGTSFYCGYFRDPDGNKINLFCTT
jgi:catechol 2,3-dioxygenase-like lactoylglutathione lyase family enzyme